MLSHHLALSSSNPGVPKGKDNSCKDTVASGGGGYNWEPSSLSGNTDPGIKF